MGSLLTKTTPHGEQEPQPTRDKPTKDEKETIDVEDVASSETGTVDVIDPTKTVTSGTGDVVDQGDTGGIDTTEATSSGTANVVSETDAATLPEPRKETAPEVHLVDSPDVATEVTDECGSPNESLGVSTEVYHDSAMPISESTADTEASHVEHSAECSSSDAEKLTNQEPESDNSPRTVAETTEMNSSADVSRNNEDDREERHLVKEHDNTPGEQHSTADIEQQLQEMNLTPNDSLQEI